MLQRFRLPARRTFLLPLVPSDVIVRNGLKANSPEAANRELSLFTVTDEG
jgi:hypothetical protein